MRRITVLALTVAALTARAADRPMPAAEAAARMTLPPGFRATLFAGDPDIVQPIAFTFDDRGRLWVVENFSYPKWSRDGTGRDRVVILEDADGDGRFDTRTVVLDNGCNLSGIEYGFGGIYLCSAPNLIHVPIKDDKPAGPPRVLLDGWNLDLGHNMVNGLAWGPDGWLYGCHGITVTSWVGKPGSNERVPFNCGVWRYHPTRHVFEPFAWGMTNPWGIDWTAEGELFATNCVIKHLFHVVPGGHYERMFGQDLNPHVYKLMESCADHVHWGGGHWTSARAKPDGTVKPEHDDAGGGHAHSGCMVYLGDNWPAEYRGDVFTLNLHGRRVNRDKLERKGSGFVARHGKDMLFAADPWFRGLALKYGPDGGVFVTDWSDTGECHNYDKADQATGRIFKVTFGTPKPWRGDLAKLSNDELVKLQAHPNEWFGRHARRLLQERGPQVAIAFGPNRHGIGSLHNLWCGHVTGMSAAQHLNWLDDPSPAVRAWAVRLLFDAEPPSFLASAGSKLAGETSPAVLLAYAGALRRHQFALGYMSGPLPLTTKDWSGDANIPLAIWYACEPAVAADAQLGPALIAKLETPLVRELIARRVAGMPGGPDALASLLLKPTPASRQRDVLAGLATALGDRRAAPMPTAWPAARPGLAAGASADVRRLLRRLNVVFGDADAITQTIRTLRNVDAPAAEREEAFDLLAFKQPVDFWGVARGQLADPVLRGRALRALAGDPNLRPADILTHYAKLTDAEKADAIATLASRPALAAALLDAVESGAVPRADVSAFTVRQLAKLKDAAVAKRVAAVWGQARPPAQEKVKLMAEYKAELTPDVLAKADLTRGRALFLRHCAACHKLHGDGGCIGPELTGSQRANLDYVLENVLDPSAVVASEYQVTDVLTKAGRLVSGIVAAETPRAVTLHTPAGAVVIPLADIDTREKSPLSMMPEGVLEALSRDERRDLVGYLAK